MNFTLYITVNLRFSDHNDNGIINVVVESENSVVALKDNPSQGMGIETDTDTGEVNMEAIITADDVLRAGGFGARDDIGSFLPVAIDSTDFEASLRDAKDFEEPQGEILRPGLGWTESRNKEE